MRISCRCRLGRQIYQLLLAMMGGWNLHIYNTQVSGYQGQRIATVGDDCCICSLPVQLCYLVQSSRAPALMFWFSTLYRELEKKKQGKYKPASNSERICILGKEGFFISAKVKNLQLQHLKKDHLPFVDGFVNSSINYL